MRMFLDDGSYYVTLLKPSPAPDHVAIGPYKFVRDGEDYVHQPDVELAADAHRGGITYITETAFEGKTRAEIANPKTV